MTRWVVHHKREPFDVYIGRPTKWGNPFSHKVDTLAEFKVSTRSEAIDRYREWLLAQPDLVAHVKRELRGKVLGCWCDPLVCHGQVLAGLANEPQTQTLSSSGTIICIDMESDARYCDRGVKPLVCMAYSFDAEHASLVSADKAVDLWLDWVNDDNITLMGHGVYNDMSVLAQAAYFKYERKHCVPGTEWAYEVAARVYDAGRIIDTEIRQRLTHVAFGPHKVAAGLGAIVKRVFGVDLSDEKTVSKEAQALLQEAVAYSQWPAGLLEATPWRVKFGSLKGLPITAYPPEAIEYTKGDVTWPRKLNAWQHEKWDSKPIPNEHLQTLASWDLHLLSIPGWLADREWAQRVRGLYQGARVYCRKRLIEDKVIHQHTVHAGKPEERVDETVKTARKQQLVYAVLGADTPVTDTAPQDHELAPEERLAFASTKAKVIHSAVVAQGAKVLNIVDAIDKAREGEATFAQWLVDSGSPTLNACTLASKASTYVTTFLDNMDTPRRIRTTYQTLVDTGRVSSRKLNVQNLPTDRDKPSELSIRGCVVPDPGWVLLLADYEQIELCALAHVLSVMVRESTGDPTYESTLARAINSGKDCHCIMAATLLSMDYDELVVIRRRAEDKKKRKEPLTAIEKTVLEHRQISKAANFGFPGGQGVNKYIEYAANYGLTLTLDQSCRSKAAFLSTWVEMAEYFRMISAAVKATGRTTVYQLYSNRVRGQCWYTQAANSLFQGLAADGAKEALHMLIRAAYRTHGSPLYGTRPSGFVHDEFIVSCREEQAERALPELERVMVAGMRKWIPDVKISAPGRIVTDRWSK